MLKTDGGACAGLGHIRRCQSLALELIKLGYRCEFYLEGDPLASEYASQSDLLTGPSGCGPIEFLSIVERAGPSAIVIDSYHYSITDFVRLGGGRYLTVALDDFGNDALPVDIVVNGAIGAHRPGGHDQDRSRYLLGPSYILLRPEFGEPVNRKPAASIKHCLISVGGSDPNNLTPRLVRWALSILEGATITVVVGPFFDNVHEIQAIAEAEPSRVTVAKHPANLRQLMLSSDLAISGGGQTLYELAATATPTIAVRVADNQTSNLAGLCEAGALIWAADRGDDDLESKVTKAMRNLATDTALRQSLSVIGPTIVDGHGASRVAREIHQLVEASR